uniref:Uncharacterized protein n=1 Tax=Ananas comosus var. bracteatus TaxID=296719 RepID=A0A6V7NEZ2_ANACO|nr:unnamed protein product [Ananas comosus var. bracteatus]
MGRSGRLNDLDKFHSAFDKFERAKMSSKGVGMVWTSIGAKWSRNEVKTAIWSCCTGTRVMAVPRHDDWTSETMILLACHLCSFAHCLWGRSLQASTLELAYATYDRSYGIEKPTGSGGIDSFPDRNAGATTDA